jgi:hypothetical protein
MNLIRPRDRLLVAGLAVALIVVFSRQLLVLIDRAREVERASGLASLALILIVFLVHQQGKRQEAKARGRSAEAGAVAAKSRGRTRGPRRRAPPRETVASPAAAHHVRSR